MATALSQLALWQGIPSGIFPKGDHVFPADLEALTSLVDALRADLAETHFVPVAELDVDEGLHVEDGLPLRLAHLRPFLVAYGPRLSAALAHEVVAANTRSRGAERVATLRGLNAPQVLIDHDAAELARLEAEAWKAEVDPFASVDDVLMAAGVVDVASRRERGQPLVVHVDIATVVLLALHCCIEENASSVHPPWLDDAQWAPIPMETELDPPVPEDVVRVRPAIYADTIEELAFADVRLLPEARAIAPGGALLRISVVASDDDE